MKKVSIAIMVTVFVATMCLAMAILPSKVYADTTYAIGDIGPAGGIVFYDKGDDVGGWRYLEAAKSDIGGTGNWSNITNTAVGAAAQGTAIGTGATNTTAIINQTVEAVTCTGGAAYLCYHLNQGGYSDWFLPSFDELTQMWNNRAIIGGFKEDWYWSSSERDSEYVGGREFISTSFTGGMLKSYQVSYWVRPIRAFSGAKTIATPATYVEPVWVRDSEMKCKVVWINGDGDFQFSFIYPYANNNWVKIYDISGKEVFSIDMPYDNPNLIVDLPNGMYTVKTFTAGSTEPIQTFVIGK
jgi:hypothetical protein